MSKPKSHPPSPNSSSLPTLRIQAAGLCCAVGYHLDAAACALRANIDHFHESEFLTPKGERLVVGRLLDTELCGPDRLARWAELAIQDCLKHITPVNTQLIPILWLVAETQRQGVTLAWWQEAFNIVNASLGLQFHPRSCFMALGRAGLAAGLERAASLLQTEKCPAVLPMGVDSFLQATTINHLLKADRLQVPGNSDGFIPGEAAAAVLLTRTQPHEAGIKVLAYQQDNEPGRPDGSVPCRSQGLSRAIRAALSDSRTPYEKLDFRVSDQNGESFFAKEAANAIARVAPTAGQQLPVLTLADCLGDVGAATGPAMLAYLSRLMPHPDSLGHTALLHLANDDGLRSAVVVEYQPR